MLICIPSHNLKKSAEVSLSHCDILWKWSARTCTYLVSCSGTSVSTVLESGEGFKLEQGQNRTELRRY